MHSHIDQQVLLQYLREQLAAPAATEVETAVEECPGCQKTLELLADLLPELPSRYELQGVLGHGGMGLVLAVRDRQLDRSTALKIPVSRNLGGSEVRRFNQEA